MGSRTYRPYDDYDIGDKIHITGTVEFKHQIVPCERHPNRIIIPEDGDCDGCSRYTRGPYDVKHGNTHECRKIVAKAAVKDEHSSGQGYYVGWALRHEGIVKGNEDGAHLDVSKKYWVARVRFSVNGPEHLAFFDNIKPIPVASFQVMDHVIIDGMRLLGYNRTDKLSKGIFIYGGDDPVMPDRVSIQTIKSTGLDIRSISGLKAALIYAKKEGN